MIKKLTLVKLRAPRRLVWYEGGSKGSNCSIIRIMVAAATTDGRYPTNLESDKDNGGR